MTDKPQGWPPEPWVQSWCHIKDANGAFVIKAESGAHGEGHYDLVPNDELGDGAEGAVMQRIVACVNACAGVPTEKLLCEVAGPDTAACKCGAIIHYTRPKESSWVLLLCRWCDERVKVNFDT
jgi:hypothetical protein